MPLSVIGLAKVWLLGPVDVDVPHGRSFNVIRAVFLGYVGSPPDGQRQGP